MIDACHSGTRGSEFILGPTGFARPLDRAPSPRPCAKAARSLASARHAPSGPFPRPSAKPARSPRPPAGDALSGPFPSASNVPTSALPRPASEAPQRPPYPVRSPALRASGGGRLWEPRRSAFILVSETLVNAGVVSSYQLGRNSQNVLAKVFIDTPNTPTAPHVALLPHTAPRELT
jgi:hypothetical protein